MRFDLNIQQFVITFTKVVRFASVRLKFGNPCRCPASSNCFMVRVKANSFPFALFHAGSPLSVLLVTQPRLLISALISGVVYRFVVQRYEILKPNLHTAPGAHK